MYTLKKIRRIYLTKVLVIFVIATFLINQAIEALVIAEFVPVWSLKASLILTALSFPLVMYVAYVIIYKNSKENETYEERVLNMWLLIFSILVLSYAIFDRFYLH